MVSSVRWKGALLAAAAFAFMLAGNAAAQATGVIEGRITEQGTGRPMSGGQVFIAGTTVGAISDGSGNYRITGVPARQVQLRVRLIGFAPVNRTVLVQAGQTARVDVEVQVSALQLEQVVVTGTGGEVAVKKLGNTVALVQPPEFAPILNPSQLLQGREAGLVGLPSSGLTGEGARIRIRGNASLAMSNEPIVFVDGVRINSGGDFGNLGNVGAGGGGSPSRLDDIDANSIERVEILKGAAAATLYGTEASNGVIQIFTKKGKSGAARWSFQAEESLSNYDDGRVKLNYGFAQRAGQADTLSKFYGRTVTPYEIISGDWSRRLMATGRGENLNAGVTGGTSNFTYYASSRYTNENGPLGGADIGPSRDINRKIGSLMNLGLVVSSAVKLGFRAGYTDAHQETPQNNNNIYGVTSLSMFAKPELANCAASAGVNDPTYGIRSVGVCKGPGNPSGNAAFMTVREAMQILTQNDAGRFTGVADLTYTPWSDVSWTSTFGIDATDDRSFNFQRFGYNIDLFTGNDVNGNRYYEARKDRQYTVDSKLLWKGQPFTSVTSDFVVGLQGFISRTNSIGGYNADFPGPGIEVIGAGATPLINESFLSTVNGGYFAQEQIGYRDWIYATVGARYDYSSAFGANASGVLYPKFSLSIVPSDLSTWNRPLGLNTFRIRGAYGRSGRQPGAFDKFTTYQALASGYGSGLAPANLGNPDLKPEVSTEYEGGFEIGTLQDKLGLDFTYWNREVKDVLVAKQFPVSGGFQARQLANIGRLEAHGYDLGAKLFLLQRQNMSLDVFANAAYIKQLVASLGGAPPLKVGGSYPRYRNFIKEGFAPGALLGAKLLQPCSARAAGATYACLQAGELPYDTNGDGKPDTEAQLLSYLSQPQTLTGMLPLRVDEDADGDFLDHYLGKPYPDWQGAFGANLTFMSNWRLGTLFEYRGGAFTVTNLTDAFRNANPLIGRNTLIAAQTGAAIENPTSTAAQRLEAAKTWLTLKALSPYDGLNQNEDGSFMRMREISLTYTAPASMAARVRARDMAISLTGRNLFLWTDYTGVDPELNAIGRTGGGGRDENYLDAVDAFGWPLQRRFALAVRLGY